MIASSTTMPMASVSASSVRLLIENPRKYITANVDTIDVGMANAGMIVARMFLRNTKMMSTTRTAATMSVSSASVIERFTKTEPSNARWIEMPGGSAAWMAGSSAMTASATSMRLAFDCRTMPMATACVPLYRRALRSSSGPSSTRPMSFSLIGWPSTFETVSSANSPGVLSSPRVRTVNSRRWLSIRPAGTSTLRLRMAASTSWTVSPRAASSAGSSQTRIE